MIKKCPALPAVILPPLETLTKCFLAMFALASLAVSGSAQSVSLSPTNLSLGSEVVGMTSGVQRVTLTNTGSAALAITSIVASKNFAQTNNCGTTVQAGAQCVIRTTFTPSRTEVITGLLTITDNAGSSPQTVGLTGVGLLPVSLSPTEAAFPSLTVGTTSPPVAFTLANNLSTAVTILDISTSGDFAQTNNCGGTLASKTRCTVNVTLTPTVVGVRTGVLTVSDSASNSPQTSSLQGTGSVSGLSSIAVTPANSVIVQGQTQQFKATGTFNNPPYIYDLTQSVTWSSTRTDVATISNATGTKGLGTAVAVGSTSIKAGIGSIQGLTELTVHSALVSISVTPAASSIAPATTQQFRAVGTYTDGGTLDITNSVTWISSATNIASISNQGLATSIATGPTTVSAVSGGISGSTNLTVTSATLATIVVAAADPSIPIGTTQQFTAIGTFTDGSTQNISGTVQWGSSNPVVATVGNATGSQGLASALVTGWTTVSATSGSVSGSTSLNVTALALVSIAVNPSQPVGAAETSQQFTAIGTFTDNSTQNLTNSVTWASSDAGVATIGNTGMATTVGTGTTAITATSVNLAGATTLTVDGATLVSIGLAPLSASVPPSATQQFSATGLFSDTSQQNVTQTVHWSSSNRTLATVSNTPGTQGLVSSIGTGPAVIAASSGTVSASASVTVTSATLVSISIAPQSPSIALGAMQQFTATGHYSDGTTQNITALATWSSSNAAFAAMNNAIPGLAASTGSGTTSITASFGSQLSSTPLTVAPAALVSIVVTPGTPTTLEGNAVQFTATGIYADDSTQNLTTSVTWSSSNSAVATISNTAGSQGLASSVATGSTTISASANSGTITNSTTLTAAAGNAPCTGPCVLTFHNDLARDGVVANESALVPANVNSASFGIVAKIKGLSGQIYAQPLYMSGLYNASSLGNVIFLATQEDYVYAFDADTYQQIWGNSYIPSTETPVPTGLGRGITCTNIYPNIGITGTPVIDPNTTFHPNPVMYFVTKSVDAGGVYHQRLHAVDVVTGAELFSQFGTEVSTPAGSAEQFLPKWENQRSGLALTYDSNQNPQIYIAWASHCDDGPYRGWLMEFTTNGGIINSTPSSYFLSTQGNGKGGGLWMSGGAPAIDNSINGNVYFATGNGSYDGESNFGQSVVKFNSGLEMLDWYTPDEWVCLNGIDGNPNCPEDSDLGSGGVVLFNVPGGVPELMAAGKQGEVWVIYQSNMGHLDPATPPMGYDPPPDCTTGPPLPMPGQDIAQCFPGIVSMNEDGSRSTPTFWNSTLYVAGASDALRAFSLSTTNVGTFNTAGAVASSPYQFGYPGAQTAVSWNGTSPSTGVLWTLQNTGFHIPVLNAILWAYTAVPDGSGLNLLYRSSARPGSGPGAIKFQAPTIANGKVFVAGQGISGTGTEGQLYVFGLCPCN
jgi:hypothetical protein